MRKEIYMFGGKKIKELENEILLLKNELQREKQNTELRRLDTLLEFFKHSVKNTNRQDEIQFDLDLDEKTLQKIEEPEIDEVLISKEYAHKIDDLHKIDFVTKDDVTKLYNNLLDTLPAKTVTHMVSHFNKNI